jgi:hypothetical protein
MSHKHIVAYLVFVYGMIILPLIVVPWVMSFNCPQGTKAEGVALFRTECVQQ